MTLPDLLTACHAILGREPESMTCSAFLNPRAFLTGLPAPTLALPIMVSTGMGGDQDQLSSGNG